MLSPEFVKQIIAGSILIDRRSQNGGGELTIINKFWK